MDMVTGILIATSLISAAKNRYELTFMTSDDPAKHRKLKFETNRFDRNSPTKQYLLTIEGNRIIDIEPVD